MFHQPDVPRLLRAAAGPYLPETGGMFVSWVLHVYVNIAPDDDWACVYDERLKYD